MSGAAERDGGGEPGYGPADDEELDGHQVWLGLLLFAFVRVGRDANDVDGERLSDFCRANKRVSSVPFLSGQNLKFREKESGKRRMKGVSSRRAKRRGQGRWQTMTDARRQALKQAGMIYVAPMR